ncbi:hypothetical protein [Salinibacter altiplanensis]|nr:hypothetical protein [Salinibacter altiplanensis]
MRPAPSTVPSDDGCTLDKIAGKPVAAVSALSVAGAFCVAVSAGGAE